MDTKTIKLIQNQLRQASVTWHVRAEVLRDAKKREQIGFYKNGKHKYKVKYRCNQCRKLYKVEHVEVDHIIEVSNDILPPSKMTMEMLFKWIEQLFCDKKNLQVLCIGCHQNKTNNYNKSRRGKKKVSLI